MLSNATLKWQMDLRICPSVKEPLLNFFPNSVWIFDRYVYPVAPWLNKYKTHSCTVMELVPTSLSRTCKICESSSCRSFNMAWKSTGRDWNEDRKAATTNVCAVRASCFSFSNCRTRKLSSLVILLLLLFPPWTCCWRLAAEAMTQVT